MTTPTPTNARRTPLAHERRARTPDDMRFPVGLVALAVIVVLILTVFALRWENDAMQDYIETLERVAKLDGAIERHQKRAGHIREGMEK